jgi:translation initiation factor RLI1
MLSIYFQNFQQGRASHVTNRQMIDSIFEAGVKRQFRLVMQEIHAYDEMLQVKEIVSIMKILDQDSLRNIFIKYVH